MGKRILGLDIRNDAVSAVVLESSLRENRIETFERIPVDPDLEFADGWKAALGELKGRIDFNGTVCVAAFPPDRVSVRNLRLPFKGAKKIAQVLPFELEPLVPYAVDDVFADFISIGETDDSQLSEVIAVATDQESLRQFIRAFEAHDLDPKTIVTGGYSAAVFMSGLKEIPENWMMIDLQGNRAVLFLMIAGKIRLIRAFPFSAGKRGPERQLCHRIRQTLTAFYEASPHLPEPERIILTGPESGNGLKSELEKQFDATAAFSGILNAPECRIQNVSEISHAPAEIDSVLALALSEAEGLNGFNLRKGPFAAHKDWEVHKKNLIRIGVFACILLMLLGLNVMMDTVMLQNRLDRLDQQITEIFRTAFPDAQRVDFPLHQMETALAEMKKSAPVSGGAGRKLPVIDILNEISRQIPDDIDVEFSRLVIDEKDLQISGDTDAFNAVDAIQSRLSESEFFRKVVISSTNKDKKKNRVRFKIKADL